jgi:hypothetical protein
VFRIYAITGYCTRTKFPFHAAIFGQIYLIEILKIASCRKSLTTFITYSITSFFRFVNKRAIYRLGIFSLAHALVHVTDFPVVNVHADELSSARIWQHTFCATLSANVNINYRLSPQTLWFRIPLSLNVLNTSFKK